ncbi:flavin monoamine oxidase family protein [Pseudovibrio sp. SCP19]|uniref:flavin monoamine oxidase family protein n=1 Tax=Pseudovibrio sp. SCP19 TaxID=3141374 RepID=UPI0033380745
MTEISRRQLLLSAAAFSAAPLFIGRAQATDTDVVVVGAGAAGISTARALKSRGYSVITIEASGRIGGRILTDNESFGVPFDMGASRLHNRENNPFADYGLANGFDIYRAPDETLMYVGNRPINDSEQAAFFQAQRKALRAMWRAGRDELDVSPASVIPDLGDWGLTVDFLIGAYEIAKDLDSFSCVDWYTAAGGSDFYCRQGIGTLFQHSARDVAVQTDVTAEKIRWGGQGVTVETSEGTIAAKAVVVTVSTGVLASGDIEFDPPLPVKKQEAIQELPMGHYFHVGLQMSKNIFGTGADAYFNYKVDEEVNGSPKAFGALTNAGGTDLCYFDMGGNFAKHLLEAGNNAAYDFVVSELKRMFGNHIEKYIVESNSYDWLHDPYTYGSYAAAKPGGFWARDEMRKSIADRIWFAGEAMSDDDWSTIAGAHKSGLIVAEEISEVL